MASIDDIFSEANFAGYARGCIDLASEMPETNFDTLVIPSRGALPIFLGMYHALSKFYWSDEHKGLYDQLCVPSLIKTLLPEGSKLHGCLDRSEKRVLLLPFTADLKLNKSEQEEIDYTRKTREFWSRVTLAFMRDPVNRDKDPYFRAFTEVILRDIERRGELAESYEKFPRAKSLALIDTVISGRASNDILRSFDQIALAGECINGASGDKLLPHSFLMIDENGAKLKPKFATYLNRKKALGSAKLYYLPRILSEDEGASLEGVAALVYPTVMEASTRLLRDGKEFFIGAGSWYVAPQTPYKDNFHKFMDLLYSAIDAKYAADFDVQRQEQEIFAQKRKEFVEYASAADLLGNHNESPSAVNNGFGYQTSGSYETGSHVVHVLFNESTTSKIVHKIIDSCSIDGVNVSMSNDNSNSKNIKSR